MPARLPTELSSLHARLAVPPAPESGAGVLLPDRVEKARTTFGDTALRGLPNLFRRELTARLEAILMALADNDLARARHESRRLAGAALAIGAVPLGQAATEMEGAIGLAGGADGRSLVQAAKQLRGAVGDARAALPHASTALPVPQVPPADFVSAKALAPCFSLAITSSEALIWPLLGQGQQRGKRAKAAR